MLNRLSIIGNLTKDPEIKNISDQMSVCRFSIAVNNPIKKSVLYIDIECWNKTAINCHKFLKKGSAVCVDGRLELNQWKSQSGESRSKIFCVADTVQFLRIDSNASTNEAKPKVKVEEEAFEEDEDEVPF
tara:strand:+ start:2388 stop:2777 length:390 start_codon:yes stop_codon:yes gene_type:complete